MSSSQSSTVLTQTEAEARFALLLKPIQELSKEQWGVNLSNNLGEYLHFLRDFSVTIEGNYKMNFAQAAMIIQNSTQLYGKRIDHLWVLMKEILDTLHNQQKSTSEDSEGAANNGTGSKVSREMCWDSTSLIDNIEIPIIKKRIDDTEDETNMSKVKFINLVPKDVLKLEDAVASANPLKVKVFNRFGDLLCYSTDLRTNLPLCASDCLLGAMNFCDIQGESQPSCERQEECPSSMHIENDCNDSFGNHTGAEDAYPECGDPCIPPNNVEVNAERNALQRPSSPFVAPVAAVSHTTNFWSPTDPYEEVGVRKEPKQGKPYKLVPQLLKNQENENNCSRLASPVDYDVFKEMFRSFSKSTYHSRKLLPEFRDDAVRRNRNRLILRRATRSLKTANSEESSDSESESEDSDNRIPSPTPSGEDNLDNDLGDSDNMFDNLRQSQPTDTTRENPFDMLERRMKEYIETAQEMAQSSEMTKRVAQWHDTIKPRLLRAENRRDFDIHEYGSKIIESFGPDAPFGTRVSFDTCLQGQEKEEVARLFLAALQLTNAGNIDIIKLNEHEVAIHKVELCLKSRDRHHEQIEEFNV